MCAKSSGVSVKDLIAMAIGLFNGLEISKAQEDCEKTFRFFSAWEVLLHHEKFSAALKPSISRTESDKEAVNFDNSGTNTEPILHIERPIGRSRAKDALEKKKNSEEQLRLAAKASATQMERNKTLKRHYEIMLFTNASAGCDESETVEYFSFMRAWAFFNLRGEKKHKKKNSHSSKESKESVRDGDDDSSEN
ncbi:unnamed protein product [Agarophyton chilense]